MFFDTEKLKKAVLPVTCCMVTLIMVALFAIVIQMDMMWQRIYDIEDLLNRAQIIMSEEGYGD